MIEIGDWTPKELYDLKVALADILIFGPWQKDGESYIRPEPARRLHDSRIFIWHHDGHDSLPQGWYFRIGFGVVGIPGITGTTPFSEPADCMRNVDEILLRAKEEQGIKLVVMG